MTLLRACAKGLKFKLVLMDLHLPRMGAKALISKIRKEPKIADTPVVLMANHHETDAEVQEQAVQANTWVRRPDEHSKLTLLIDRIVRFFLARKVAVSQRSAEEVRL